MPRLLGVDIPNNRQIVISLTYLYGVGPAILAGDGLLNFAYETMLDGALRYRDHMDRHLLAMAEIARGAGARGMMAGQSMDLELVRKPGSRLQDLEFIHENKTAALFVYGLRAAGRLCGADGETLLALERFGRAFGLLFQTVDDLLDVEGDEKTLGKTVGKDEHSGKLTAVRVYGLGGVRELIHQILEEGLDALSPFGEAADDFRRLIRSAASREA